MPGSNHFPSAEEEGHAAQPGIDCVADFFSEYDLTPNSDLAQNSITREKENLEAFEEQTYFETVLDETWEPPQAAETPRLPSQQQCGRGSILGIDPLTREAILIPARCKTWDCPECGPRKRAAWIARLASGRPNRVLTLTAPPEIAPTIAARAIILKRAWKRIVQRIRYHCSLCYDTRWLPPRQRRKKIAALKKKGIAWRKKTPDEFEYAIVWELKGSNHLHCHVLVRGPYIPEGWLSWNWQNLGGGCVVWINKSNGDQHEAAHVAKDFLRKPHGLTVKPENYVSKQTAHTAEAIAPLKLIHTSENYEQNNSELQNPEKQPLRQWTALRMDAHEYVRRLQTSKYIGFLETAKDGTFTFRIHDAPNLSEVIELGDPWKK